MGIKMGMRVVLRGYWNLYASGFTWVCEWVCESKLGYGGKVGMKGAGVAGSCRIAFLPVDLHLFHLFLFISRKLMNC